MISKIIGTLLTLLVIFGMSLLIIPAAGILFGILKSLTQ